MRWRTFAGPGVNRSTASHRIDDRLGFFSEQVPFDIDAFEQCSPRTTLDHQPVPPGHAPNLSVKLKREVRASLPRKQLGCATGFSTIFLQPRRLPLEFPELIGETFG